MPLYEYECKSCGYEFEELIKDDTILSCKKCGYIVEKKISSFSAVINGGTSNETIDMTIGREANKKWQLIHDEQTKRRGDKELQSFELPKTKDGKHMPIMALGNKDERETRKEYATALQEHRHEREKRNQPQFSEAGTF